MFVCGKTNVSHHPAPTLGTISHIILCFWWVWAMENLNLAFKKKSKLSKRKFHLCFAKCMVFTRISPNITQYEQISLVLMLLSNFTGFKNVYVIFFVPFFFLFHLDAFLHFILFFFEICVFKTF
jgi:hypothetical protein